MRGPLGVGELAAMVVPLGDVVLYVGSCLARLTSCTPRGQARRSQDAEGEGTAHLSCGN
jgi:hypothetical protein